MPTLLGSRSQVARIAAQTAFEIGAGDGPCSLIGLGQRTDVLNAALINGTTAHPDLFDDNNAPMSAHPSSPLVSALLPLARTKGIGTLASIRSPASAKLSKRAAPP
jgi:2-methylcitrate dehydratase PrpD